MSGRTVIPVAVSVLLGLSVWACSSKPSESTPKKGPPQEAFAACDGKAEGDACKMDGEKGEMEGRCVKGPEGSKEGRLSCAPEHRKGPPPKDDEGNGTKGHRPPPPGAEGQKGDGPPPMMGKEPPVEAIAACADKAEGDACEAQMGDKKMEGECRRGPSGEESKLACMPKPSNKE